MIYHTGAPASLAPIKIMINSGIFGKTTAILSPDLIFNFLNDVANLPLSFLNSP